jgi:metal-responsive CopG/Arc/MetJ family transcriptional regulator
MQIVQVVLDKKLLQAADRAARKLKRNRPALVRDALKEYLRKLEIHDRENRDRDGYSNKPSRGTPNIWEGEAVWPDE